MNPYIFARETAERANDGVIAISGRRVLVLDARTRLKEMEAAFCYAESQGAEFFETFRSIFFGDGCRE